MTFNEWLQEVEVYGTRGERLQATFAHYDKYEWNALVEWAKAAYDAGYHSGKQDEGVPF
jgi:hypothetical protein